MDKLIIAIISAVIAATIAFGATYLLLGHNGTNNTNWVPHKGDYLEYTVTGPMVSATVKIKIIDENQTHVKTYFTISGLAAILPVNNETAIWLPKNNVTKELYELYRNCTKTGYERITILGKTLRTIKYVCSEPEKNETTTIWVEGHGIPVKMVTTGTTDWFGEKLNLSITMRLTDTNIELLDAK